ncbi:hypothetical protein BOTBODRAFT_189071 [Botryobasidium botryosum FD-172 SS1]|uniref:Clp1-like protein n=1 Tax=Botryobasidium botryosum (strain FD-172 SS1) TaxID=930990 RepID=A0A067MBA8_BOTB1|nr:hypothetical protein BOTBODRAFT_189071 [Botryobasidium botryosum FD-172 SS1]
MATRSNRTPSATWGHFASMEPRNGLPPLPRQLPIFPMPEVDPYVIGDVDPDYQGAPMSYVLGKLHALSPQLTRGIMSVVTDAGGVSSTSIPRDMDLTVRDVSATLPTHMLAVLNEQSGKGYLYPFHALVLAAHCASLPLMPLAPRHPQPRLRSNKTHTITVPVVRLSLPHPESFRILHDYLYTKRCDILMSSLLPLPPSSLPRLDSCVSGTLRKLSSALASAHSTNALIERCRNIHGLWSNVCKLGIADDSLWRVMEVAWSVLIESIDISAGIKH